MRLASIAREIDRRAESRPIGRLQELRKELRGLRRPPSCHIFSSKTTFEAKDYAFHVGGRKELQFNIGIERGGREKKFMHGVAFDLERSRSLPDVSVLYPKVGRFNEFMKSHPQEFSDLRMWHLCSGEPSSKYPPRPIPPDLVKPGVFIFLGRWQPLAKIDFGLVLDDFDRLLSLYRSVEGGDAPAVVTERTGRFQFRPGCTTKAVTTTTTMAKGHLTVDLRQNKIQRALHEYLVSLYGPDAVGTECPSGTDGQVDVVVRRGRKYWFYEIKTASSARDCIREALAQLLEYSFWPGGQEADRLIIVGEASLDSESRNFLDRLKRRFSLPIRYQQFDARKARLVASER